MPVTELAQLSLLLPDETFTTTTTTTPPPIAGTSSSTTPPPPPPIPTDLLSSFKHAHQVLNTASGHQFQFYRGIEDTSKIYIIGRWDSVAYHRDVFLPSPENQLLLEMLRDRVKVDYMFHVDTRAQGSAGGGVADADASFDINVDVDVDVDVNVDFDFDFDSKRREDSGSTMVMQCHYVAPAKLQEPGFHASFDRRVVEFHSFVKRNGGTVLASGWRRRDEVAGPADAVVAFVVFLYWPAAVGGRLRITQIDGYAVYEKYMGQVCEHPIETASMVDLGF